jgi:hypothetical protein
MSKANAPKGRTRRLLGRTGDFAVTSVITLGASLGAGPAYGPVITLFVLSSLVTALLR